MIVEEYLYFIDRALDGMSAIAQHHGQMEITRDLLTARAGAASSRPRPHVQERR